MPVSVGSLSTTPAESPSFAAGNVGQGDNAGVCGVSRSTVKMHDPDRVSVILWVWPQEPWSLRNVCLPTCQVRRHTTGGTCGKGAYLAGPASSGQP